MPPCVSGGNLTHHMGKFGNVVFPSQGMLNIKMHVHAYMGNMGGGYYPTGQGHGLY